MKPIPVLGVGSVALTRYPEDGEALIADAARICYGDKKLRSDAGLVEHLFAKGHFSPFEFVNLTYRLKVPIFVMRQLVRHRTHAMAEKSLRYCTAKPEFYVLPGHEATMLPAYQAAYEAYTALCAAGVPKGQARCVLPVATFTECYWQMNLRNLFNLFDQRCDKHAQIETQVVAGAMLALADAIFPTAIRAWRMKQVIQ